MKNIYVLPTEEPSGLHYSKIKSNDQISYKLVLKKEFSRCNDGLLSGQRYIYITSDEEIKDNTWVLNIVNGVIYKTYSGINFNLDTEKERWRKIILTTDQDLIKDGVQAIDDDFLEWFVKNPSCEHVKVEELYFHGSGYYKASELSEQEKEKYSFMKTYKIIIPKEDIKQETLEEAKFNNLIKLFGKDFDLESSNTIKNCNVSFEEGAKWQQEQEQNNENSWFNEYQEVENYIIKRIGNKFLEATPDKYKTASEATIALLENNWKKENMYSEEDLREAFRQGELNINYSEMYGLDSELTEQQWFEQFKKNES